MAKDITKTFIKRKHEVEEPDATKVHRHGPTEDRAPFDPQRSNVFLIGPRCSGKTTLAEAAAHRLGMTARDTDAMLVDRLGQSIEAFVREHGWPEFRKREQEQLQEVCRQQGQIVATGGGIVILPENRRLLKAFGSVFYLLAGLETLVERQQADAEKSGRPSLHPEAASLREEIGRVLQDREPLYFETLDFILQAEKPLQSLVEDLATMLGAHGQEGG